MYTIDTAVTGGVSVIISYTTSDLDTLINAIRTTYYNIKHNHHDDNELREAVELFRKFKPSSVSYSVFFASMYKVLCHDPDYKASTYIRVHNTYTSFILPYLEAAEVVYKLMDLTDAPVHV